jgi:hypothetical protein
VDPRENKLGVIGIDLKMLNISNFTWDLIGIMIITVRYFTKISAIERPGNVKKI